MSLLKEALTFATGILILVAFIVPMVGLAVGLPVNAPVLTANGVELPQIAPFASSLVATSSTVWDVVMNFDQDISTPAVVADGTPSFDFTNGTLQVVNDCGDANAKTYCFTYVPPSGIEAAVFWFFRVSGAANAANDYMATTTYRFIVDTAGPILSFTGVASTELPTVEGDSSFGSATVNITFSDASLSRTYQTTAAGGFWSLTLQPGDELPPGTYSIVAIGIDQYQNIGAPIVTSVTVPDTIPPVLAESAAIASSTNTTPSYTFTSSEFANLAYGGGCASQTLTAATGTNTIVFDALVPGDYPFCIITPTDGASNVGATLNVTAFTIALPPASNIPTDKDQCKKNGWKTFTNPSFKNQGDCVSFVEKKDHDDEDRMESDKKDKDDKERKNDENRSEKDRENRDNRDSRRHN